MVLIIIIKVFQTLYKDIIIINMVRRIIHKVRKTFCML
jgi:hypothetical protein